MNHLSLLKKYSDTVSPQILAQYREPQKVLWVNTDDKDLIPIPIQLPECPEYHLIDGFGLPAREQKFKPPVLPRRLKELQKKFNMLEEIWNELETNQDIYNEEIKFIKKQWYHRLYGYWFFNNGTPTFIDGWQYLYCCWWYIDIGLPQFRDRDRKFFLFARMIYTDTRAFKNLNDKGFAIANEKGDYEYIDLGHRVHYGFNYPKYRREGATYKAELINYEITSRTMNAASGIQSMNDTKARSCFLRHLVAPWKKLPFFFKPNYEGSTSPKSELSFAPPATRLSAKGSLISSQIGLESIINYEDADEGAYDGDKLYFHHDDEVGKLKKGISCWARHLVVKECLKMGADIIGFTIKTSTVGEMEKGGGKIFKHQCTMSNFYQRNNNGETPSGLAVLFISSVEGLKGFIDEHGMSVIDTPTKEQAKYINRNYGSREYLLNNRKGFLDAGDYEGLSEEIRKYPMKFTECFRTSAKETGFNMQKLETYIDALRFRKDLGLIRGNFAWQKNVEKPRVIFHEDPAGKFLLKIQLNDNESNRTWYDEERSSWMPGNTSWGVAGGDPFKFNKTAGNRKSNGGGAVITKGLYPIHKRGFACRYEYRPFDKNVYAEDMLMMCVYYGVKMFSEINIPLLWDYFESRGYSEFLLYKWDPKTQKESETPGASTNEKIKQDIFSEYMTWIENEAMDETMIEVLEDCMGKNCSQKRHSRNLACSRATCGWIFWI